MGVVERRGRDILGDRYRSCSNLRDDYERGLLLKSSWGDHIEQDFWTDEALT